MTSHHVTHYVTVVMCLFIVQKKKKTNKNKNKNKKNK